ncbi:hypothetical protein C7N43_16695 [Sphingobacteriales bacterium UPWRP_1]|nr:hypothetical protein C7N43_16695 [Sphingobacteriales bacterium UPWRP_1]
MQPYINQLLQDLNAAQNNLPPPKDYALLYPNHPAADPQYDGELNYIIEWEMGDEQPMEDLFGISADALPPVELLTDEQAGSLCDAILNLWQAFNILADYPHKVPIKLLYQALRNYWIEKPVSYTSAGHLHLEFCHYKPEECPWGLEYCTCKDLAEEWKKNPVQLTPEEEAYWEKGLQPDGGWVNPDLLDENGNFDPDKLKSFGENDEAESLPF